MSVKVLFLCLGNICRSPMAEAVFRQLVEKRGLAKAIEIDSAGLGDWHIGQRPHHGTLEILNKHGYAHDALRSRQIQRAEIPSFDYIVAMDNANLRGLEELGAKPGPRVFRLLEVVKEQFEKDVPDPYYTGNFDAVYELIHVGCERLLDKILAHHPERE